MEANMNELKAALDKEGLKIKEALEKIGYKYMNFDIEKCNIGSKNNIDFHIWARLEGEKLGQ